LLTVQASTGVVQVLAGAAKVPSINVAFPESLLFYSSGAIVLEAIYRLILITVPLWLIANVILRKRGLAPVFWALALLTSALEPVQQLNLLAGHLGLMLTVGVVTYGVNVFEAHLFWRRGFLAPLVFSCRLLLGLARRGRRPWFVDEADRASIKSCYPLARFDWIFPQPERDDDGIREEHAAGGEEQRSQS
jgi:hypothetical protein